MIDYIIDLPEKVNHNLLRYSSPFPLFPDLRFIQEFMGTGERSSGVIKWVRKTLRPESTTSDISF